MTNKKLKKCSIGSSPSYLDPPDQIIQVQILIQFGMGPFEKIGINFNNLQPKAWISF